jgi:hypothetical protein
MSRCALKQLVGASGGESAIVTRRRIGEERIGAHLCIRDTMVA